MKNNDILMINIVAFMPNFAANNLVNTFRLSKWGTVSLDYPAYTVEIGKITNKLEPLEGSSAVRFVLKGKCIVGEGKVNKYVLV